MSMKVGDTVVHPIYGVGEIVGLEERQFASAEVRRYFQVSTGKTMVWVPVETCEVVGLRHLIAKADLAAYRNVLKSRPLSLDKDHAKRRRELAESLRRGSFQAMCELVRDLTARGWRRPLGESDARLLRKTHETLCQEWAAADSASIARATQEVDTMLLEAKRAYA
ncbi:MAG: CarD family transcriptional regulator [Chloroflexota bacterium]